MILLEDGPILEVTNSKIPQQDIQLQMTQSSRFCGSARNAVSDVPEHTRLSKERRENAQYTKGAHPVAANTNAPSHNVEETFCPVSEVLVHLLQTNAPVREKVGICLP